ncbi:CPBP family intramembrane glutamic endopeptidase [Pyxidicoccus sp. 3LG]
MKALFVNSENSVRSGWKVLGYFLVTGLFAVGLIFLRRLLPDAARPFVPEPLLAFLGAWVASWLCVRLERTSSLAHVFGLGGRSGRELSLGLAAGAVAVGLVAFGVWLLDGFHLGQAPGGAASELLKGAWVMMAAALFEETVFHGYAFQRAIKGMGPLWAQLLFSVIFVLLHPFTPGMEGSVMVLATLNTFLACWVFGYCYLRTGSLALPVGAHWGWNWALGSLGFGVSGNESKGLWVPVFHGKPAWLTGGDYGLEASVVCLVILVLSLVGLVCWKGSTARVQPLAPPHVPAAGEVA